VGQVPLTALVLPFVLRCASQVDAMDTAHRSVTELVPETGKTSPSDKPQPASSSSSSFPSPTQHAAAEPEKKLREVQRTTEKLQDEQEKEHPEVEEHDRSAAAKGEEDRNGEAQAFAEFNVREKLAHVAPGQPDHERKTKGGPESVEAQTETPGPGREAAGASSPQDEASDPNEKVASTAQDEKIAPHQRWPLSDVPQWLASFVDKKAPMLGREPAAEREHAPVGREEAGDLEQESSRSSSALEVGADAAPGVAAASGSVVNPDASTAKKSTTTVILMNKSTSPAPAAPEAGDSSKSPATSTSLMATTTSAGNEKDFPNKLTPTPGIWSNPPTGESLTPDMTCKEEWCSSPGPNGSKDCFAGSGEEPCTCEQGSAVQLDETVYHEGATYYRYVCCKLEPDDERWHAANGKEKRHPNFTGEYCGRYHGGLLIFWYLVFSCVCCSGCGMLIGSTDFMKGADSHPPPQPNVPVTVSPPQPNVPVAPTTGSQT